MSGYLALLCLFVSGAVCVDLQTNVDILELRDVVDQLKSELTQLKTSTLTTDNHLQSELLVAQSEVKSLRSEMYAALNSTDGEYVEHGCSFDVLTLTCAAPKTIVVERAYYGQYADTKCSDSTDCCAPDDLHDCSESVEENSPWDWNAISLLCNVSSTCSFENPGRDIESCAAPYASDYLVVYYTCVPVAPSGFSARPSANAAYSDGVLVAFDVPVTNVGDNYDPTLSTFTCPVDGLYVFSLTVTGYQSDYFRANIVYEGSILTSAVTYTESTLYDQGSSMAVTGCKTGEQVWVECAAMSSYLLQAGGDPVFSSFSGFLLQAY